MAIFAIVTKEMTLYGEGNESQARTYAARLSLPGDPAKVRELQEFEAKKIPCYDILPLAGANEKMQSLFNTIMS